MFNSLTFDPSNDHTGVFHFDDLFWTCHGAAIRPLERIHGQWYALAMLYPAGIDGSDRFMVKGYHLTGNKADEPQLICVPEPNHQTLFHELWNDSIQRDRCGLFQFRFVNNGRGIISELRVTSIPWDKVT